MSDNISKIALALSCVAIVGAGVSIFLPKSLVINEKDDAQVEESVKRIFQKNPQSLLDVLNNAVSMKNKEATNQMCNDIFTNRESIKKQAIVLGNKNAEKYIIAFNDPLCPHCRTFQREIVKRIEKDGDLCVYILPVAAISEDSITIAQLYYAVNEKKPNQINKFLKDVADMRDINNNGIVALLKGVGLTQSDISSIVNSCRECVSQNGMLAEKLGIPVVPAIFIVGQTSANMMQPGQTIDEVMKSVQ